MVLLDLTSDIDRVVKDSERMMREIPYIASRSMNEAAFETRRHIVEVTWVAAFEVRNKAFPRRLFRLLKKTDKSDLEAILGTALDRGWVGLHTTGGTKRPAGGGSTIAVPRDSNSVRTSNGRVSKPKKPRNITSKKNMFLVKNKAGEKRAIVQRRSKRGKPDVIYVFAKQAKIDKAFYFYEDAEKVFVREMRPAFLKWADQVLSKHGF